VKDLEPAVPIPESEEPGDEDRGLVRRGRQVLGWVLLLVLSVTAVVEALGFRYVQNVVWPTDLVTFQHMETGPLDVVILGSSRASFAFSPTAIDRCLASELGEPTRSVNLARVYSTPLSWRSLTESLLSEEQIPDVLVIGIAPEAFNEEHHQNAMLFSMEASMADVPALYGASQGLHEVVGAISPLVRGVESLGLLLSGRFDNEERLRWMMMHQRGGQFCVGSASCENQNQAFADLSAYRWRKFVETRQGMIQGDRFERYRVGNGVYHDNMVRLLDWAEANDVQILAVNMPLHPLFEEQIPADVTDTYYSYVLQLEADYPHFSTYEGNTGDWRSDESYFLDPDHLGAEGALGFSEMVCSDAIAPLLRQIAGGISTTLDLQDVDESTAGRVASQIKARRSTIEDCYNNELAKDSGLTGTIVVYLDIYGGMTESINVTGMTSSLQSCVYSQVESWRFDGVDDASGIQLTYSLRPSK